ncbi:hypothetical protein J437_LFUL001606 [Ladona fulva]|uniref:Uncharacterized protein n=1 Tax=Ladona fulva TaxID=123851 RepID=A0A8K0PA26_LADFU|nr:hypothetical protein J437_LFUL001606 [Ladona fulva]
MVLDAPLEHQAQDIDSFLFEENSEGYIGKILQLIWQTTSDAFSFHIQYNLVPTTKKAILSKVSCLYDPLGFIALVVFVGKCILQRVWQLGVGWDEVLPDDVSLPSQEA